MGTPDDHQRKPILQTIDKAGTFTLGSRIVKRFGYGAMQLAGPGVFGPPRDRDAAVAVLREAVSLGINHFDTSDFYGHTSPTRSSGTRWVPTPKVW